MHKAQIKCPECGQIFADMDRPAPYTQADCDAYHATCERDGARAVLVTGKEVYTPTSDPEPDPVEAMTAYLAGLASARQEKLDRLTGACAVAMLSLGLDQADVMAEGAAFGGDHAVAIYAYVSKAAPLLLAEVQADKREWLRQKLPTGRTILDLFEEALCSG